MKKLSICLSAAELNEIEDALNFQVECLKKSFEDFPSPEIYSHLTKATNAVENFNKLMSFFEDDCDETT